MDARTYQGSQKYLKAVDLQQPVVVTIREAIEETVGLNQDAKQKLVLYFGGMEKGLTLNSTNIDSLIEMFSNDTLAWPGKSSTAMGPATLNTNKNTSGNTLLALRTIMTTATPTIIR